MIIPLRLVFCTFPAYVILEHTASPAVAEDLGIHILGVPLH